MLTAQLVPAREAGVQIEQRRALRRLLRDIVALTGSTLTELAATPRKPSQPQRRRLLYRRALSDGDLDTLVGEIGVERLWAAVERATQPRLPLVAAE
jgi:hypothetical protein